MSRKTTIVIDDEQVEVTVESNDIQDNATDDVVVVQAVRTGKTD